MALRHSNIERWQIIILVLILSFFQSHLSRAQDKLLDVMTAELEREMSVLQTRDTPPYFMGYTVSDVHNTTVRASFGALTASDVSDRRLLTVDMRVGDYNLDNTHELRDQFDYSMEGYVLLARDDNPDALRAAIWQETNRKYRQAVERYTKVKTNVALKVAEEDTSADFSNINVPLHFFESPLDIENLVGDCSLWEKKVKKYSALFLANKNIYGGQASFRFTMERKNLVTSEGTSLVQNLTYAQISVSGFIKSDDGMELPLYKSYFAFTPDGLPGDNDILSDIEIMIDELDGLRDAPVVEPYTGPAILSGRAAAVFFHEIMGHRIEGHRLKSEHEGQTFKKQVGEKILPEHISIVFDPLRREYNENYLMGYYRYDDEGVKAQRVNVIESGVLTNFLMSRSPVENFPGSNGHARAQSGRRPVSRQSNMLISTSSPVPEQELREKLIDLCKKQDKPYGLLFQDIQGGFTLTGRTLPNVFNLLPVKVFLVYTDGRPDELVRGVDLVGTPLVMFSMITEAGDTPEIFSGMCGAESGYIPVSAVSPALLVTQVEVQKKSKSQERPPILPRPDLDEIKK
ncbi:metallopeptidase TldD-related protein [Candidatus Latescibacterota bacterium]